MAKDDLLLGVELGKLEIEPTKTIKLNKDDNPFILTTSHKCLSSRNNYVKCSCSALKHNNNNVTICKKRSNKVIKEPVLKILQIQKNNNFKKETSLQQSHHSDLLNLCDLVDNCNQLRISSGKKKQNLEVNSEGSSKHKWWKADMTHVKQVRKPVAEKSQAGTCSQQALNPSCDVTIDELASYFETLVHIPKKMSSMAEMMYI